VTVTENEALVLERKLAQDKVAEYVTTTNALQLELARLRLTVATATALLDTDMAGEAKRVLEKS